MVGFARNSGRHEIGMMAGFRSEEVAGFAGMRISAGRSVRAVSRIDLNALVTSAMHSSPFFPAVQPAGRTVGGPLRATRAQ